MNCTSTNVWKYSKAPLIQTSSNLDVLVTQTKSKYTCTLYIVYLVIRTNHRSLNPNLLKKTPEDPLFINGMQKKSAEVAFRVFKDEKSQVKKVSC